MNFQNMEYFMMAAETGNITRAAERLHISQQALSDCLSRMESELGCRLFERRQGLELTYGGRQYRAAVKRMLDLYKQTVVMLNDINENIRGELRVGISYTRGQAILPMVLPEFVRRFPLVELSVQEDSTQMLESLLERGEIDVMIGFAPFRIDRAESFPLMKDRLHLVIPKILLRDRWSTSHGPRRRGHRDRRMPGALPQQQLCGFRHSRVVYPPVGRGMSPVRRFPFRHHRHRIQQGPLLQQDRRKLHPLMPGKNARSGISHPVSGNSSGNMRNSSGNWNAKSRTRREAHKSHSLRGSSFFFSSSLWYRRKNKPAVKKSMKPRRKPGRLVYS